MPEGPNGSPGLNKLARTISKRAEQVAGKAPRDLVLDFGSIQDDMSLLTNTFPIPIPKKEYHVLRQLTLGATGEKLTTTTTNGTYSHSHNVLIPEKMRKIKPGDRVLVAWVLNEAVIIDIVTKL